MDRRRAAFATVVTVAVGLTLVGLAPPRLMAQVQPTIAISPTCTAANTSFGLAVSGNGFTPGRPGTVFLDGQLIGSFTVSYTGTWTFSASRPGLPPGDHVVLGREQVVGGGTGLEASALLRVPCTTGTTGGTASTLPPTTTSSKPTTTVTTAVPATTTPMPGSATSSGGPTTTTFPTGSTVAPADATITTEAAPGASTPPTTRRTTTTERPVPPPPPDGRPPSSPDRSTFPASVAAAGDVSWSFPHVLASALVAVLLMTAIAFPAELFNKTLEENHDDIARWFGRLRPPRPWPARVTVPLVAVATAGLGVVLDPDAGADGRTLALFLGLVVAVAVTLAAMELPQVLVRRRDGVGGLAFRAYPASFAIAVLCAVVSRLAGFRPGYLYGAVAGVVVLGVGAEKERSEGRAAAAGAAVLLLCSLGAWLVWGPVGRAAADPGPSFATLLADAALAGIFVVGLETVVFGLVPVRFLDGRSIAEWRPPVWLLVEGLAVLTFAVVIANPGTGSERTEATSVAAAGSVFVAFALLSIAFWAAFTLRARLLERRRALAPPDG